MKIEILNGDLDTENDIFIISGVGVDNYQTNIFEDFELRLDKFVGKIIDIEKKDNSISIEIEPVRNLNYFDFYPSFRVIDFEKNGQINIIRKCELISIGAKKRDGQIHDKVKEFNKPYEKIMIWRRLTASVFLLLCLSPLLGLFDWKAAIVVFICFLTLFLGLGQVYFKLERRINERIQGTPKEADSSTDKE
jgi:hypothetical protein